MKLMYRLRQSGIFYAVKSIFLQILIKKLKNERIIFNSSFNENYNFNSKYLFEYFIKSKEILENYEIKFVINDDEKRKKLNNSIGNFFIEGKSLKGMKYILESKTWISSTIDPPLLTFFKNKERFFYHLGHGVPLKKIILAEENTTLIQKLNRKLRIKNITHALATSKILKPKIFQAFGSNDKVKIVINGQPRNDKLFEVSELKITDFIEVENEDDKLILYSPTWRPYGETKIFPFPDVSLDKISSFLEENKLILCIREHPYYKVEFPKGIERIKRIQHLNSDKITDIMPYLNQFSGLITDYSSIYLDFLLLELPMLFINSDVEVYEKEVGFFLDYNDFAPGPKVKTQEEFLNELDKLIIDNTYFLKERKLVNKKINAYKTDNCESNCNYILSKIKI